VLETIASGTWVTGGILVLATYRQGELGLALGELREEGAVKDIQVGRLDRESARAMAIGIVGGAELPEAMVEQVTDHGEGNPFFISEYLRAAVREGVLRRSDGRWQAHDPDGAGIASLPMPPSIRELVEGRFERLSPSAQSMAELAAVIGRRIDPTVALAAFEGSEADALDAINELLRTEMVENGPDGALHFVPMLHDATYERIDLERRAALHTAVAQALEPLDEWPGKDAELAHHYLEAGIFEPAIERLEQAGLRALASGSYGAALSYFEWAIGATETQSLDVPIVRRARWERCLGDASYALGDLGGAMSHARHALELLGHPLPPTGKGAVLALAREVYARISRQHADPSALEEAALAAVRVGECAYFTMLSQPFLPADGR
jgi:tetratricopeptide (TPR) repeat protein